MRREGAEQMQNKKLPTYNKCFWGGTCLPEMKRHACNETSNRLDLSTCTYSSTSHHQTTRPAERKHAEVCMHVSMYNGVRQSTHMKHMKHMKHLRLETSSTLAKTLGRKEQVICCAALRSLEVTTASMVLHTETNGMITPTDTLHLYNSTIG